MQYLCHVRYVGTDFRGFQFQPGVRTVQGVLTEAAKRVFGCPCAVTGCSRTDSGVHADAFCATVSPADGVLRVPPEKLGAAFLPHLASDIAVTDARAVGDGFHPRYDAIEKEYRYLIRRAPLPDPFFAHRSWQIPQPFLPDGLERMQKAAAAFLGKHDFVGFRAEGSDVATTVRTINSFSVERDGDLYTLRVAADGFLYNMVRILAGTLVAVADGHLSPDDIPAVIASRERKRAGVTAPPDGLYLSRVRYDEKDFLKTT